MISLSTKRPSTLKSGKFEFQFCMSCSEDIRFHFDLLQNYLLVLKDNSMALHLRCYLFIKDDMIHKWWTKQIISLAFLDSFIYANLISNLLDASLMNKEIRNKYLICKFIFQSSVRHLKYARRLPKINNYIIKW